LVKLGGMRKAYGEALRELGNQNPEVVVLGGGLAGAGELILKSLRRAVRQWGQPLGSRQVHIVRSRLGEDAGILGAARYALIHREEGI